MQFIDKIALISIGALYFLFHLTYISYFLVRYRRYSSVGYQDSHEIGKDKDDTDSDNRIINEAESNNKTTNDGHNPRKNN
ncbi:unnamed protein product [Brachionus calyciflorus]|uniref:Uncharacterized protein n=1 Tax=Brachionus calyciflorus TaxID=104777 RepID=A0A814H1F2_9BILA|nr:unnamed protein product [Brachionus calyciflorus]